MPWAIPATAALFPACFPLSVPICIIHLLFVVRLYKSQQFVVQVILRRLHAPAKAPFIIEENVPSANVYIFLLVRMLVVDLQPLKLPHM